MVSFGIYEYLTIQGQRTNGRDEVRVRGIIWE